MNYENYVCPVCKAPGTAFASCDYPGCADGRMPSSCDQPRRNIAGVADEAEPPTIDFYATYRTPRPRDLRAMWFRLLVVLALLAAAWFVVRAGYALAFIWPV